jgi:hypothetical protein
LGFLLRQITVVVDPDGIPLGVEIEASSAALAERP